MVNDGGADPSSVLDGIANLVAKSLVALDRDTASRWYLLETIRAYALEKLDGHGERATAARRHATYFRDLFSRSAAVSDASVSADERISTPLTVKRDLEDVAWRRAAVARSP